MYTMEYDSAIKKEWINAICSNMEATRDSHTKWSKPEKERQTPHDITYIWNLKYGRNEPMHKTETDSGTWRTGGGRGKGGGSELDWSLGLVDANYCIWSGWAMRSYHITQGTISSLLGENMMEDNMRKEYIYIYLGSSRHGTVVNESD